MAFQGHNYFQCLSTLLFVFLLFYPCVSHEILSESWLAATDCPVHSQKEAGVHVSCGKPSLRAEIPLLSHTSAKEV